MNRDLFNLLLVVLVLMTIIFARQRQFFDEEVHCLRKDDDCKKSPGIFHDEELDSPTSQPWHDEDYRTTPNEYEEADDEETTA